MSALGAIRAVLIDKDGTLLDFHATWFAVAEGLAMEAAGGDAECARELLRAGGYDFASGRFRAGSVIAAGTNAELVDFWLPGLGIAARRDWLAHVDAVTAHSGAANAKPIAGSREALADLHRAGLRLGVATNDSTAGAEMTLRALGIGQFFDAVFGYDAVANPKPAPDMADAFAEAVRVKPRQVAMIGDNHDDIATGKAAGVGVTIGVLSGTGTRETLARADIIMNSIADLPGLFP